MFHKNFARVAKIRVITVYGSLHDSDHFYPCSHNGYFHIFASSTTTLRCTTCIQNILIRWSSCTRLCAQGAAWNQNCHQNKRSRVPTNCEENLNYQADALIAARQANINRPQTWPSDYISCKGASKQYPQLATIFRSIFEVKPNFKWYEPSLD